MTELTSLPLPSGPERGAAEALVMKGTLAAESLLPSVVLELLHLLGHAGI